MKKPKREELPNVTAGSERSSLGHDRRTDINQSEYTDEASDKSGASFITFRNDYAAVRNRMKEGDVGEEAGADIRYSLSDSEGKQLSKEQDYFKDNKVRE